MSNVPSKQEFAAWVAKMQARVAQSMINGEKLFLATGGDGLWETYITSFNSAIERNYHFCHACRNFLRNYGGLVVINDRGHANPVLWDVDDAPPYYKTVVRALIDYIGKQEVAGVFFPDNSAIGVQRTNRPIEKEWYHFGIVLPNSAIAKSLFKNAGQLAAEKKQDFATVLTALGEFKLEHLQQAVGLLEADVMYRSNTVLGPAKWLYELSFAWHSEKNARKRNNLVWRAVATAPSGFCHPRSSMIGTLLEDLAAGYDLNTVGARFKAKMHPLQYQRAQVAPTQGNLNRASDLIEKAGLETAPKRRFASVEEIPTVWQPNKRNSAIVREAKQTEGLFAGIEAKKSTVTPASKTLLRGDHMSWTRFANDVMPRAVGIKFVAHRANYGAIVGPTDPNAPNLFQWGNPFNWYRYYAGSDPDNWNLLGGTEYSVKAIALLPWMWDTNFKGEHFDKSALFILENCHDATNGGSALFTATMKSDFHEIRSTIEAYSNANKLARANGTPACGVLFNEKLGALPLTVEFQNFAQQVVIDRWE